jgi:hypothetical protein
MWDIELFMYLHGGTEENHENLRQYSQSPRLVSNSRPPEFEWVLSSQPQRLVKWITAVFES